MRDGDDIRPPPGWADALLEVSLPDDPRGATILGDVHEEFYERVEEDGEATARRWFIVSAIALSARYIARRGRRRVFTTQGGGETMTSIIADDEQGFLENWISYQ